MTVRVEGLGRLRSALERLRVSMHAGALEGEQATAQAVSADWKSNAPVETGEYRDSIGVVPEGVGATAEHGPFVEFGTSRTRAQPVGTEAADRGARKMPGIVAVTVKRRLPR
jgi:hypothetical protein